MDRRPLWYLAAGFAGAALLAVVLFVGVGTGRSRAASGVPTIVNPNLEPGINAPTSNLLSLTVLHGRTPVVPEFTLTDQHGRAVSPSDFRGRVVVVSVNDDQCEDLCTLLANDIVVANRDLGSEAKDVVWLSVNANPFYPQVSAVRAWTDQHGLGGQRNWYFATGSPKDLAKVWKEYGVYVQLDRKTRSVEHGTELYYVAPDGQERAVAEFGTAAANTAQFGHGLAQLAADLLPGRSHVPGPEVPAPTATDAAVGAPAPGFSLPYLLNGHGEFSLAADRGRPTVVTFFSSTCVACRSEEPAVEAAHRSVGKKVNFVAVDVSDTDSRGRAFAERAGITFPVVADRDGVAAGSERISGLPFTVVLDAHGTVLVRHPGLFTTEQIKYLLASFAGMAD